MGLYVQYGCGLSAPEGWINFDASPTLRLQKMPLIGFIAKNKVKFPPNVRYGDIVKGLPGIEKGSCEGLYCSHVLEHLSLKDFYTALQNSYDLLEPRGIFRCVLPDLEWSIRKYLEEQRTDINNASIHFMQNTLLGVEERPKGLKENIINMFGNANHLWMWDINSLRNALTNVGFNNLRRCNYHDSPDPRFREVEDEGRFTAAIGFECIK